MRGYFGIGIDNCKLSVNIGSLWRSAQAFDANHIFTIGKRYKQQHSDISKSHRHIPLYEYEDFYDFLKHLPKDCKLIGIEYPGKHNLTNFIHPERAIYVLGAENTGLSREILLRCLTTIQIPSKICINVSVAGSIVMYDRLQKMR